MQREAGNRTMLPAKLGMPAGPVPTSWLQCAELTQRYGLEVTRGKSSSLPKSGGMAKAIRRQTGAGAR